MKKTKYSIPLLLASALILTGCSFFDTSEDTAKSGFASFTGTSISDDEGELIAASATTNASTASHVTLTAKQTEDTTELFTGGVANQATSTVLDYAIDVKVYSNYMLNEDIVYTGKSTTFGGASISSYTKESDAVWAGNPVDGALTGVYTLFIQETMTDADGNSAGSYCGILEPSFCPTADVEDAWGLTVANTISIYSYSTDQRFYKIDDSHFASLTTETSSGSMTNPLFPNDDAKKIVTSSYGEEAFFFEKIDGAYFVTKMVSIKKVFAVTDLSLEALSSPLIISNVTSEYELTYGNKTAGTLPTYVENPVITVVPVLVTLTDVGDLSASNGIANITTSYRLLNPGFTGYAYRETVTLTSGNYYAFTTEADMTTANYDRWGFGSIDQSSIKYGTIGVSGVNNYFNAVDGSYSILVLLDADQNLTSLQVSYLHD